MQLFQQKMEVEGKVRDEWCAVQVLSIPGRSQWAANDLISPYACGAGPARPVLRRWALT